MKNELYYKCKNWSVFMVMSLGGLSTSPAYKQKQVQQAEMKKRYDDVYAHELAHKNAAGAFGGSIVIEKDANGIVTGGHVDIKMPALDKKNPDKTISHANTVIKAAMAPGDPSEQDYKVAAQAKAIRAEAEESKNKKAGQKLNIVA